jgi:EAL and modified HD-GYP domain-containing signal transduction protein
MRLNFSRNPGLRDVEAGESSKIEPLTDPLETSGTADDHVDRRDADGYVTYAVLLDAQRRVVGYKMVWCATVGHEREGAGAQFSALVSTVATHLNPKKTGWRLGRLILFFDVTVDALFQSELQSLPPENVVLCMELDDLSDADARPMLVFLRKQGFGFMLCNALALPQDPEVRAIITHFDVGAGDADLVAGIRREAQSGQPAVELVATRTASWKDFDACAARRVNVFVNRLLASPPTKEPGNALQPESLLIVRLMQMIQRNEDVREIEAALKHDAALTYRLLRHINSPAIGVGVEIHSLRHAVSMLGYSPLFRWLLLLLATSNTRVNSPFMMKKAILRGRFVELMGQSMLPASESDNLFVVGMFSLIDQLLGVSIQEVLGKVQLAESIQQAILTREGAYGPFLALAETCELDGSDAARLSEALFMEASQVNAAHMSALVWSQDVGPAETAY